MVIRPLGPMEYTYWLMGLSSRTNFTIGVQISGGLSVDCLKNALKIVQQQHPLLTVCIVPDKKDGALFVKTTQLIPVSSSPNNSDTDQPEPGNLRPFRIQLFLSYHHGLRIV